MSGITIQIPGANFTKFFDRTFPHVDKASGYWLFGTDEASSKRNLIDGSNATVVSAGAGVATYGKGFVDFPTGPAPDSVGFDSGIVFAGLDKSSFTYVAVVDAVISNAFYQNEICGTHRTGSNGNYLQRNIGGVLGAWNGSGALVAGPAPVGAMVFVALTNSPTGRAVYLHDGTVLKETTGTAGAAPTADNSYRIGPVNGLGNQSQPGSVRHAANLLYKGKLTAAQLLEVYSYLKFKCGQRGVNVL